jgi:hypothetical protein
MEFVWVEKRSGKCSLVWCGMPTLCVTISHPTSKPVRLSAPTTLAGKTMASMDLSGASVPHLHALTSLMTARARDMRKHMSGEHIQGVLDSDGSVGYTVCQSALSVVGACYAGCA